MGKKFIRRDTFTRLMATCHHKDKLVIVVETNPQMRKTNNPYAGRVTKHTIMEVTINNDYVDEVNQRRIQEGKEPTFEASKLPWGTHVTGPQNEPTPLIEHNGQHYLQCQVTKTNESTYLLDGHPVDNDTLIDIKKYIPPKTEAAKQELKDTVVIRTFKLSSIVGIIAGTRTTPII